MANKVVLDPYYRRVILGDVSDNSIYLVFYSATHVRRLHKFVTCLKNVKASNIDTETNGTKTNNDYVQLY